MHQLLVIFLTLTLYSCKIFKNSILVVDADPQFQRWQMLKNGQQWEKDQPVQEEQEPPLLTEAELKQLQAAMEEMNLQNRRLQQRIDENILAGNFPKQPMPMIPSVQIPHNSPQMVPVQMAMPPSSIAQQVTQPQVSAIDYMMLNLYLSTKLEKAKKQEENCQDDDDCCR